LNLLHNLIKSNEKPINSIQSRSFSLNNTTDNDRLIEPMMAKIEQLKQNLEVFNRKIACSISASETLMQKQRELNSIILDYRKKNENLDYLNFLASRKFSNIETVDFKARESKVIDFFWLKNEFFP